MFAVLLVVLVALLDIASAVTADKRDCWYDDCEQQVKSFEKINVSPSLLEASNPAKTGLLPVAWSDDEQSYYSVISVGNISFRVALDTGSADLWITSSACTTSACHSVPKYPLTYQSPSFASVNDNNTAFSVSFADGTAASGYVAREKVQLSNLTVPNQAFGMVSQSNVTMGSQMSGILGLGFPRLSTISNNVVNATPFFASLSQQGIVNYPLFGLSLTRNTSGTLTLGAIDSSVVKDVSQIEWNEVVAFSPFGTERNTTSYLQWAIPMGNILVNGSAITPSPTYPTAYSNQSLALLDVGTPGIYGPYQDVSSIFSAIDGSRLVDTKDGGQWALPCDVSETISFVFGTTNFTLQPSDYLIGPTSGNPDLCLAWPRASAPSSDGIDWQLGSPFLRTVYSIFSYGIDAKEPPMIGLYPRNNASAPVESPQYISSFMSAASATVATTLPNYLLPTPSYSTPPFAFNTSIPASIGQIVTSDLATSTYSPILATPAALNVTAIPTVSPSPTLLTLIITDTSGEVRTTTSTASTPSVTLGVPYGWSASAGSRLPVPLSRTLLACLSLVVLVLSSTS
ncbi:acid protease [Gloeophyllum trabeum ATCC 11539]|uniref:Acid protease n=1 Tax=Gloeophyllum trabeum (strain ATCC 11539 / FP-39264 / Madison 617) TaxID=670483 RepID=S7RMZ0_GLOTA|nr:acid protease [Gloeophyllum trabeum ATCC 11539]EPQ54079.1 acid protease [Gloeophyllum trabeum ATCC 11539]